MIILNNHLLQNLDFRAQKILNLVMEPVNFVKVWGCKCTLCNPSTAPEECAIIDSCLSESYYHKFQQQWHKPFNFDKHRSCILYIPLLQSNKPWTSYTNKLTVITSARILIRILIKLGASYDPILDKVICSTCEALCIVCVVNIGLSCSKFS